jgi:hypothetical protein
MVLIMSLKAQPNYSQLADSENQLKALLVSINKEESLSKKNAKNYDLVKAFEETLNIEGAWDYPFDSLKNIGKLRSGDNKVRIFTWNLPQPAGNQKYFGFIMVNNENNINIFKLNDLRVEYEIPHLLIGSTSNWYGALYYEIIDIENNGKTIYTLLGVDMNNLFSSKRIIEVLSFDSRGEPVFGLPIFRINKSVLNRVVLEYSARATMVTKWLKEHNMIVYNHLTPLRPDYEGNYQFYVPDPSLDGLKYRNPYWEYVPDIDIRNPSKEKSTKAIRVENDGFDPGFNYKSSKPKK